jgi:hypothetical protein
MKDFATLGILLGISPGKCRRPSCLISKRGKDASAHLFENFHAKESQLQGFQHCFLTCPETGTKFRSVLKVKINWTTLLVLSSNLLTAVFKDVLTVKVQKLRALCSGGETRCLKQAYATSIIDVTSVVFMYKSCYFSSRSITKASN